MSKSQRILFDISGHDQKTNKKLRNSCILTNFSEKKHPEGQKCVAGLALLSDKNCIKSFSEET